MKSPNNLVIVLLTLRGAFRLSVSEVQRILGSDSNSLCIPIPNLEVKPFLCHNTLYFNYAFFNWI